MTHAALIGLALVGLGLVLWLVGAPWPGWLIAFTPSAILSFGPIGLRASTFASTVPIPALEGQDIDMMGQVVAMPQFGEDGVRFCFAVTSARLKGEKGTLPSQIYFGWYLGFGLRPAKTAPVHIVDGETEPPDFHLSCSAGRSLCAQANTGK